MSGIRPTRRQADADIIVPLPLEWISPPDEPTSPPKPPGGASSRRNAPPTTDVMAEMPVNAAAQDTTIVTVSSTGLIGRTGTDRLTLRPGIDDLIVAAATSSCNSHIAAITSSGRWLPVAVADIPTVTATSRGTHLDTLFGTDPGERLVGLVAADSHSDSITIVTRAGTVKRLTRDEAAQTAAAATVIGLKGDDTVTAAFACDDVDDLVIVTDEAQLLRFPANTVRPQGRGGVGVAGIATRGAQVIGAGAGRAGDIVVTWTRKGATKRSAIDDYPTKGRGTGGVLCMRTRADDLDIIGAHIGPDQPLGYSTVDGSVEVLTIANSRPNSSGNDVGAHIVGQLREHRATSMPDPSVP